MCVEPERIGLRLDADRQKAVLDAEVPHDVHGVGADLDAGADLAELRRLLVNLDLMAGLHQAGRGGQPAETRARDQDPILLHSNARPPFFLVLVLTTPPGCVKRAVTQPGRAQMARRWDFGSGAAKRTRTSTGCPASTSS